MPRVLLIGFGPFPGVPRNPSTTLVRALGRSNRDVKVVVLPTTYAAVRIVLPRLLRKHDPEIVLMFGVAARSHAVRIETQAFNAASGRRPDAKGSLPPRPLFEDAPRVLKVKAPIARMIEAARGTGIPVRRSLSAGRYICNAALYACLDTVRRDRHPRRIAFVHIPPPLGWLTPALPRGRRRALAEYVRAGDAILHAMGGR